MTLKGGEPMMTTTGLIKQRILAPALEIFPVPISNLLKTLVPEMAVHGVPRATGDMDIWISQVVAAEKRHLARPERVHRPIAPGFVEVQTAEVGE